MNFFSKISTGTLITIVRGVTGTAKVEVTGTYKFIEAKCGIEGV